MGIIIDTILGAPRSDDTSLAALAALGVRPRFRVVGTLAQVQAVTGAAGEEAFATNLGTTGTILRWSATANAWRVAQVQTLHAGRTLVAGVTGTTEQVLGQLSLPAGWRASVGALRVYLAFGRTGVTDSCTARLRVGSLGTVSDLNLGSVQISGTGRNLAGTTEIVPDSATTLGLAGAQLYGSNPWPWVAGTAGIPLAFTVPSMDTGTTFISLGVAMSGSTDTAQVRTFVIEALG